jgi:ABC-type branched-subunit amino acid transport system ATPase component
MDTLLKLDMVTAGYGGGDVLKGISFAVERGSLTCIIGPNGAGKSTVLRVLSGLLKARLGKIAFDGRSLASLTPRQILALGIVQVPQNHSLFPGMTVRDNMELGGYLLRHDQPTLRRRMTEVEALYPVVKERARDLAGSLSGGQQRLVEIARSLLLDPALVLLDEPSMSLDPKTLKQVFETIVTLHGTGRTILLVEQNVRSALAIATHGLVLESGQVRLAGTAQELLGHPEMNHLFFGGTLSTS